MTAARRALLAAAARTTTTPGPDPDPPSWYQPTANEVVQWQIDGAAVAAPLSAMAPYTLIGIDFRDGDDEEQAPNASDNVASRTARRNRIAAWQAQGKHVWAYIPAGDWESYRWDAAEGEPHTGGSLGGDFAEERWVNFTGSHLAPVLAWLYARIDEAASDGFDGVEFDMIEAAETHQYDPGATGFAVTHTEQASFNRALFTYAHSLGMFVAMKGYAAKVGDFEPDTDMVIMEEPLSAGTGRRDQCIAGLAAYVAAGKHVCCVEYPITVVPSYCTQANTHGWDLFFKNLNLDQPRNACT